jgi:ATP-binding cassette subfamily B protein
MKLSSSISNDLAYEMRRKIFSHVNSLSTKEIDSIGVPSLINRNTGDVMKVARGLEFTLKLGIAAPGMMIGGIIKAVVDSSNTFASTFAVASFSLAIVFTLIILLIFLSVIGPIVISRMKKLAFFSDDLNEKARENITGVRVIRAFDAQKLHIASTDKISEKIYRNNFAFCF